MLGTTLGSCGFLQWPSSVGNFHRSLPAQVLFVLTPNPQDSCPQIGLLSWSSLLLAIFLGCNIRCFQQFFFIHTPPLSLKRPPASSTHLMQHCSFPSSQQHTLFYSCSFCSQGYHFAVLINHFLPSPLKYTMQWDAAVLLKLYPFSWFLEICRNYITFQIPGCLASS